MGWVRGCQTLLSTLFPTVYRWRAEVKEAGCLLAEVWVAALFVAFVGLCSGGCTSAAEMSLREPDPANPKTWRRGCVRDSLAVQANRSGKLLPERVVVIGVYAHDSSMWMVVKDGYDSWVPMPKRKVLWLCEKAAGGVILDMGQSGSAESPRLPDE